MEGARLIVGLGNPGGEYVRTRHNAGFVLVETLAQRWRATWHTEAGLRARLASAEPAGCRCWLAQPLTYMNASGVAVAAIMRYYRLSCEHLLVALDDADLPLGELRLRPGGGTGGHHGLESITEHLGTRDYPRLRLGIGRRAAAGQQLTGHVLGRFDRDEAAVFDQVVGRAVEAVACWLAAGIGPAMNRFNGAAFAPETKES